MSGARVNAIPSAGRNKRGLRSVRGGAGCADADSAARAGGRAGAPVHYKILYFSLPKCISFFRVVYLNNKRRRKS